MVTGLVGLAVTVCLNVQRFFNILVTVFTRLEKGMVNTERILHYVRETVPESLGFGQVIYKKIQMYLTRDSFRMFRSHQVRTF